MRKNMLRASSQRAVLIGADTSGASQNLSFDITGLTLSGRFCIVFCACDSLSGEFTTPSGFTSVHYSGANLTVTRLYTKVLDGTETTISVLGDEAGQDSAGIAMVFRGVDDPGDVSTGDITFASGSSGAPNPPASNAIATQKDILLILGSQDDTIGGMTSPAGYSLIGEAEWDGGGGNGIQVIAAYAIGLNGIVNPDSFTSAGSDNWHAYTVFLAQT